VTGNEVEAGQIGKRIASVAVVLCQQIVGELLQQIGDVVRHGLLTPAG
jgi:hypothetical protein